MSPDARHPAAGGNRGGFASFFETNKDMSLRFIRWKGVPDADTDAINQETWLSLLRYWDRRGTPETEEHARNLLLQIAQRRVNDYWRAVGRRPRTEVWDPRVHDVLDSSSTEKCDWLLENLTTRGTQPTLTPRQETAFRLVHLDGRSLQEAAAYMGITQNALEKLLIRAKEAIRQARQAAQTRTEEGTR